MSRTARRPILGGTGGTGATLNSPIPTQTEREAAETVEDEQPKSKLDYLFGKDKLQNLDKSISELLFHSGGVVGSTRVDPYSRMHIVHPKYIYGSTLSFYDSNKKKEMDKKRKGVEHVKYSLIREMMSTKIGKNLGSSIILKDFEQPNVSKKIYISNKNKEFFEDLELISNKMKSNEDTLLIVVRGIKGKEEENSRKNYQRGTYFVCHQRGKTVVQEERRYKITNELIQYYTNNVHNPHIRFTMHNIHQQEGEYLNCLARFDTKRNQRTLREAMKDEIIMTLCNEDRIGSDYDSNDDYVECIEEFIKELFEEVREFFIEKKYLTIERKKPIQRRRFRTKNINVGIDYIIERGYVEAYGLKVIQPNQRGGEITFEDNDDDIFKVPKLKFVHENLREVMKYTLRKNLNEYENRIEIEEILKNNRINFLAPVIFANQKKLYNPKDDNEFIVIKSINEKLAQVIIDKFLELYYIPFRKKIRELRLIRLMFFEYKDRGYYLRSGEFNSTAKETPKNTTTTSQKTPDVPATTAYGELFEIPNTSDDEEENENVKDGKDYTIMNRIISMFEGENKYINPRVLNIGDINLLLLDYNFIRRDKNAWNVYQKAKRFLKVTERTKKMENDLDFPNPFVMIQGKARTNKRKMLDSRIKNIILDGIMKEYKEVHKFRNYDEARKNDIVDAVLWKDLKKELKSKTELETGDPPVLGDALKQKMKENAYKHLQYTFWNPDDEHLQKTPTLLNKLAEFTIKYGAGVFFCQIRNEPTKLVDPQDYKSKVKSIFKNDDEDEIQNEAVQRKMLVFSSEQDPSEILFNYCLYGFNGRKKPFFIGEENVINDYYHNALLVNFREHRMRNLREQKDPEYYENLTYVEDIDEFYRKIENKF